MDPTPRRPFNFHFKSQSPALGCLLLVVGLVVALALGVVAILALLWRLITSPFSTAPAPSPQSSSPQTDHSIVEAIEVESVIIPDTSIPAVRDPGSNVNNDDSR